MNHTKKDYSLLDWDSKFFGFHVAIILCNDISVSRLEDLLRTLQKQGVRLVYWPAASTYDLSNEQLKKLNGILADKKTTFKIRLDAIKAPLPFNSQTVERYNQSIPLTNLESLAIQCGQFSRFAVDPKIPPKKFIELYNLWIEKSVTKQMADEVLIIRNNKYIQGIISLKKSKTSGTGEIGLLVVDKKFRNQKLGRQLVEAGLEWFKTSNYKCVTVDTQGGNIAACHLYQKCGFSEIKLVNYYHFWI